jgi:hypothetical protein
MANDGAGIFGFLGDIASLILTGYGMYSQEEEAQRARRAYEEATKEEKRRFGVELGLRKTQIGLQREQIAFQERESRRAWRWKEEERDYSRVESFVNNFNNLIDDPRQGSRDLFDVWSRRAA